MNVNIKYLRPKKGKKLKESIDKFQIISKKPDYIELINATILPDKKIKKNDQIVHLGGVVDSKKKYCEMSSIKNWIQGTYDVGDTDKENKTVVYLGLFRKHWGHLLGEWASRLWYFFEDDGNVDEYIYIYDENLEVNIDRNFKRFFQLLGIYDKIRIINKPIQFSKVIVPEMAYKISRSCSICFLKAFDKIREKALNCPDPNWESWDRIYFSRGRFQKQKKYELGNDMLDNYFKKNGFKIIYPEKLTLENLIYILNNAKTVATVSGTLQHNLIFANQNLNVITIERWPINNRIQTDFIKIKELNSTNIDSFISVYPWEYGMDLDVYSYNKLFDSFTVDNGFKKPDKKFLTDRYKKKLLKFFMASYYKKYLFKWYKDTECDENIELIREAYLDSEAIYSPYFNDGKPLFCWQMFTVWFVKYVYHLFGFNEIIFRMLIKIKKSITNKIKMIK